MRARPRITVGVDNNTRAYAHAAAHTHESTHVQINLVNTKGTEIAKMSDQCVWWWDGGFLCYSETTDELPTKRSSLVSIYRYNTEANSMEIVGQFNGADFNNITIRYGYLWAFRKDRLECEVFCMQPGIPRRGVYPLNRIDGQPAFDTSKYIDWHMIVAVQDDDDIAYIFYTINHVGEVELHCGMLCDCILIGYDGGGIVMHRVASCEPLLVWKPMAMIGDVSATMPSTAMPAATYQDNDHTGACTADAKLPSDPDRELRITGTKIYQIPVCDLLIRSSSAPGTPKYHVGYDRSVIRCICAEGYRGVVCIDTRTMTLQPGQYNVQFPTEFILTNKVVIWSDGKRLLDLYRDSDLTPHLEAIICSRALQAQQRRPCTGIVSVMICCTGPLVAAICEAGHYHMFSVFASHSSAHLGTSSLESPQL